MIGTPKREKKLAKPVAERKQFEVVEKDWKPKTEV